MRPISEFAGQELLWIQPVVRKREHELRAGDDVVATLGFQRGSLADAQAAGGHWTFKRQGFWHPRVTVRTAGSDTDIAVFQPRWVGGGTLEFPDGRTVRLSSANFWQSEWLWQDNEKPLIRFKGRHGIVKARGAVELEPDVVASPDLAMLVLLGWYLILLHAEDSAAASSAASVAAVSG
ncbi:MAG TPA: hypothetical protein VN973_00395 [Candidatus Dormibacteraeota bacterium]|nr:hypothetical protein [Candidatus Dormibacteraeota bacterium]